jgi:hypothetical protein
MTQKVTIPKQNGRILTFLPDDFEVVLPFGVGVKKDNCSFHVRGTNSDRTVFARHKPEPQVEIQIYPPYSAVEYITLNRKSVRIKFWVVVSDLDRLRARQLIEREHYLMPTARGLFLVCGLEQGAQEKRPKIIGVAVLDAMLHGNPKLGRSQFATKELKSEAWLKWPRDRIVNELRLAWASRFAVHSSYHGCGIGTRLAFHLKSVARRFRVPSANFIEVITTVPKSSQGGSDKRDFLIRAGYARMEAPLKSAPLRLLNHDTGYMDSVSAKKYYYYVNLRSD